MRQIRRVRVRTVLRARVVGLLVSIAIVLWGVAAVLAATPGTFSNTGSMATGRFNHTATLLANGNVLIARGSGAAGTLASAEIFDPVTGTFSATGSMATARASHTATLLPNGKVLIAGGDGGADPNVPVSLNSAELYDVSAGTFSATGSMATTRVAHAAVLVATLRRPGRAVLVTGGFDGAILGSAELYTP